MKKTPEIVVLSENRKAYHDFQVIEKLEVGIELIGSEVKSIRNRSVNLGGAYVQVLKGELWLVGSNIAISGAFTSGTNSNRDRKLLCHKKEIAELKHKSEAKGFTIVPLRLYQKNGRIKLEIGVAKGKNVIDKRKTLKDKDLKRDAEREF